MEGSRSWLPARAEAWRPAVSPAAPTRSGPAPRGVGLRGAAAGPARLWAPLGLAGRGGPRWGRCALPAAPHPVAVVAAKEPATSCARPATAAAPVLVPVRVREAEPRPLLRSLFRRGPRRCAWRRPHPSLLPSAEVSGLCPGTLWSPDLGAAMVWGWGSCFLVPLRRPRPGPWVKWHPGRTAPAWRLSPEPLSAAFSAFSPPPAQRLGLGFRRRVVRPLWVQPCAAFSKSFFFSRWL